ncbi:MAG: phosphate signaling complex protein PhoU, partial [Candidatus Anammoxibacter sp.]
MRKEALTTLKQRLTEYATLIENMIEKSVNGLVKKNNDLFVEVIEEDEPKANHTEIELDQLCTGLIARFQPQASDLRMILMGLKMNSDLERMGDAAVNICESGIFLIERPSVNVLTDISKIAHESTKEMLRNSIKAFVNKDVKLAKTVCERDDIVDELKDKIIRKLIKIMSSDASTIERAFHLIRITQNLERIADL